MTKLTISLAVCASLVSQPMLADDGGYSDAYEVEITHKVEGAADSVREVFWLISLGGSDLVDAYKLLPSPVAGQTIIVGGSTETNSKPDITLDLVKRFGGEVVSSANLSHAESFTSWTVTAPVFLRVTASADTPNQEILIGIRIIPPAPSSAETSISDGSSGDFGGFTLPIPDSETGPIPPLVAPLND